MANIEQAIHELRDMQRALARTGTILSITDPDPKLKTRHPDAVLAAATQPPVRLAWHMTADGLLHCGDIPCTAADMPRMIADANTARAADIRDLWTKICTHLDTTRPHPLPHDAAERVREYEKTAAGLLALGMEDAPEILNDEEYETLTRLDATPRPGDTASLADARLLEPVFAPENVHLRLTAKGRESIELTDTETR